MPSLSQLLFWAYFHVEAKNSTLTNTPTQIWHYPSRKEIEKIVRLNWYDFHQMYTITFIVDSLNEETLPYPIIAFFFF